MLSYGNIPSGCFIKGEIFLDLTSKNLSSIMNGEVGSPLLEPDKAAKLLAPALNAVCDEMRLTINLRFGQQRLAIGPASVNNGFNQSLPLQSGSRTIGHAEVKTTKPLSDQQVDTLRTILLAFASNWQRRWTIEVVRSLTKPIPLEGKAYEYNCLLSEMILDLFFCDHVFLRKYSDRGFECVGYAGSQDESEFEAHVISRSKSGDIFDFLNLLMLSRNSEDSQRVAHVSGKEFSNLLGSIRDIVFDKELSCAITTPLLVGGKPYGIISLLFRNEEDAQVLQDEVLSLVANHVAMAISHFEKANELAKNRSDRAMKARDKFNFEIIQGLRHSASNNLSSLQMNFQSLKNRVKGPLTTDKDSPLHRVESDIRLLSFDLSNMEKLTAIKNEGSSVFRLIDVRSIFEECLDLLPGNKAVKSDPRKKIHHNVQSPKLLALCEPDFLRYAFLNLIMNSVRAINDKKQHSHNESITFVARDIGDRYQIDLSDTGGGIPLGQGSILTVDDIWEEGKTSKANGTGQGLVMVRDAIQEIHRGTIMVLHNDPNLTLRIELPKFPAGDRETYDQLVRASKL